MPYIITTSEPFDAAVHTARPAFTRRAVGTLAEARDAARREACQNHGYAQDYDTRAVEYALVREAISALPEAGGTIGPLPDGTRIEVAPIFWHDLLRAIQPSCINAVQRNGVDNRAAIIDAWNARHA